MRIRPEEADRFCAAPPPGLVAALVWGEDSALAAERRARLAAAIAGPDAAAEMRVAELDAGTLRADPAALDAALRARGFFAGPRVVLLGGASDVHAEAVAAALAGAAAPDAALIVSAGDLRAKSALRRLFDEARNAASVPCPEAPPDRETLAAMLEAAGAGRPDRDALAALEALAEALDRGQLRQLAATVALYRGGADGAVTAEDVAAVAPAGLGAAVDDVVAAVADGDAARLGRAAARVAAQGVSPTAVAIATARHFRALHVLAAARDPEAAAQRLRPPAWGARRDALVRQARRWGLARIERAIAQLHALDGDLRGGAEGPKAAMLERALLRLALAAER